MQQQKRVNPFAKKCETPPVGRIQIRIYVQLINILIGQAQQRLDDSLGKENLNIVCVKNQTR